MMYCSVSGQNIDTSSMTSSTQSLNNLTSQGSNTNTVYYYDSTPNTLWGYWSGVYYPQIIRESYPVYIQEKAMDKGKQAYELVKALMDKKLLNVEKVKDFVEAMDTILKTL